MGDGDEGVVGAGTVAHEVLRQPGHALHVEVVGGLVEQEDRGVGDEEAGEGEPAALATGQRPDGGVEAADRLRPDPAQEPGEDVADPRVAGPLVLGAVAELPATPAYVLAAAQGAPGGYAELNENDDHYTSSGFVSGPSGSGVASRIWARAGVKPGEVDVVQVYENFSGPAVASLIDHGLCPPGPAAGAFMTVENLTAPSGRLPVNTSGGNIADSFVNGMGLAVEAVRQIRGTSPNQLETVDTSLYIGGPMAPLVSSVLFGSERSL